MMDAHGLANGRHRAIMDPKMPGERTPHAVSLGLDAAKQVEEYIKVRRFSCRVFRFFFVVPFQESALLLNTQEKRHVFLWSHKSAKCPILRLTADGH